MNDNLLKWRVKAAYVENTNEIDRDSRCCSGQALSILGHSTAGVWCRGSEGNNCVEGLRRGEPDIETAQE
jgi:hypothetical protein